MELKCYRVWFSDGGAIQVDAVSKEDAMNQAGPMYESEDPNVYITSAECLTPKKKETA